MKYKIILIREDSVTKTFYKIELHNLAIEADPHSLCYLDLKLGIELSRIVAAVEFCKQLKIVLGSDICEITSNDEDIIRCYL